MPTDISYRVINCVKCRCLYKKYFLKEWYWIHGEGIEKLNSLITSVKHTCKMFRAVFWVVLPCKMIVDRRFRGAYCLHHQG
jgi:hypothetical protein